MSSQDPNDFTITAEFKDGRIGGTSAVNQYGGPYTAGDDGSISFGDLVSTMMAGPEPDMKAEQIYLELLDQVEEVRHRRRRAHALGRGRQHRAHLQPQPGVAESVTAGQVRAPGRRRVPA